MMYFSWMAGLKKRKRTKLKMQKLLRVERCSFAKSMQVFVAFLKIVNLSKKPQNLRDNIGMFYGSEEVRSCVVCITQLKQCSQVQENTEKREFTKISPFQILQTTYLFNSINNDQYAKEMKKSERTAIIKTVAVSIWCTRSSTVQRDNSYLSMSIASWIK